ncbi:MAG: hypothetical protein C0183_10045, partial [Roseiflexus castenholzii]
MPPAEERNSKHLRTLRQKPESKQRGRRVAISDDDPRSADRFLFDATSLRLHNRYEGATIPMMTELKRLVVGRPLAN